MSRWTLEQQLLRAVEDVRALELLLGENGGDVPEPNAHPFFENELAMVQAELQRLRAEVDTAPLEGSWRRFATQRARLDRLRDHVVSYLASFDLRARGAHRQIFTIADELLREIAKEGVLPWTGFTLPGGRTLIDLRAGTIGLPFPELVVWDLPVVAHELGHYATRHLLDEMGLEPLRRMLEAEPEGRRRAHLEELFADVFGAYVLGPAAVCTTLTLCFNPGTSLATRGTATHPSFAQRGRWLLRVLERRAPQGGSATAGAWRWLVDRLTESWQEGLNLAAPDGEAEPSVPDARFDEIYGFLALRPAAAYETWPRAVDLAHELGEDQGPVPATLDRASCRDVLNAAWLARLRDTSSAHTLARAAEIALGSLSP